MLRIVYVFRLNSKRQRSLSGGGENDRTEKIVRNEIQIQALGYTTKKHTIPKVLRFRSHLKQLKRKGENV